MSDHPLPTLCDYLNPRRGQTFGVGGVGGVSGVGGVRSAGSVSAGSVLENEHNHFSRRRGPASITRLRNNLRRAIRVSRAAERALCIRARGSSPATPSNPGRRCSISRPLKKRFPSNRTLVVALWAGMTLFAQADPQVSGTASFSPTTLVAGETTVATFTFTFTNTDDSKSSPMTDTHLRVTWPGAYINGVFHNLELISMNAGGGNVTYDFDAEGNISAVDVDYLPVAADTSRTFTASFSIPAAGLSDGSIVQSNAKLTWSQDPGTLNSSATASIQATPALQATLEPVPAYTAPGGLIRYQVQLLNTGGGVTRKGWVVIPIHPATRLVHVNAAAGGPRAWFTTTAYTLEQVTTDDFIRSHFQAGILDENETPGDTSDDFWSVPENTRTMAVFLDDPDVNLLLCGIPSDLSWQVETSSENAEGAVIDQSLGYFADGVPAATSDFLTSVIHELPAELRIIKTPDGVQLNFFGDPEASYRIARSSGLLDWPDIGPAVPVQGSPGAFEFHDPTPPPSRGFYRVSEE